MPLNYINIAIAFRDKDGSYARHVGAMLASLLDNTRRSVRVHILHDDSLTEDSRKKLQAVLDQQIPAAHGHTHGQEQKHAHARESQLHFHHLDPRTCLPGVNESSLIMQPLTFATLYRLFLPTLPGLKDCSRLIYMDTDLIVDADMSELWEMELGQALLGAVPDPCLCGALTRPVRNAKDEWARNVARHSLGLGIPMTRYFNAGVLLLDLASIRREGLFAEGAQMVQNEPRLLHPDQDALNKLFYGRSIFIPQKFNNLLHSCDVEGKEEGVWHYSGPRKPWDHPHMPKADRYFYYLRQTPWGKALEEGKLA